MVLAAIASALPAHIAYGQYQTHKEELIQLRAAPEPTTPKINIEIERSLE